LQAYPTQSTLPGERRPAAAAFLRLARLTSAGAAVHTVAAAVRGIIAEWRAHDPQVDLFAFRLAALQDDVDASVLAAEDFLADTDVDGTPAARVQLDALKAIQTALKAESEVLR
jgi:hypothetical protein